MTFNINADLSWVTDIINTITFFDMSFLLGSALALIICFLVSSDMHHFKINFFPTIVLLHIMGLYQNALVIVVALLLWALETFSFKMIGDTITSVGTAIESSWDMARTEVARTRMLRAGLSRDDAALMLQMEKAARASRLTNRSKELQTGILKGQDTLTLAQKQYLLPYLQADLSTVEYDSAVNAKRMEPATAFQNLKHKNNMEYTGAISDIQQTSSENAREKYLDNMAHLQVVKEIQTTSKLNAIERAALDIAGIDYKNMSAREIIALKNSSFLETVNKAAKIKAQGIKESSNVFVKTAKVTAKIRNNSNKLVAKQMQKQEKERSANRTKESSAAKKLVDYAHGLRTQHSATVSKGVDKAHKQKESLSDKINRNITKHANVKRKDSHRTTKSMHNYRDRVEKWNDPWGFKRRRR